MSAFVISWLNDELVLSNGTVKVIEREFASGFLFAEVLSKTHPTLVTSDDLAKFQNEKKTQEMTLAEVKAHNAGELKRVFRRAKLPADDATILNITQEDRGTSLRLLYQIKKSLDVPMVHKEKEKIPRIPKKVIDDKQAYWYKMGGHHEPLLKPFLDEERDQEMYGKYLDQIQEDEILHGRDVHRAHRLNRMHFQQAMAEEFDEHVLEFWKKTVKRDMLKTTEEVRVELEVLQREQTIINRIRKFYRDDTFDGTESFERNLQRIGIDTSEGELQPAEVQRWLKHQESIATPLQLLDNMKNELPSKQTLFLESLVHMSKIRRAGANARQAAQERERRRRKQSVQAAIETQEVLATGEKTALVDKFTKLMKSQQQQSDDIMKIKLLDEKEKEFRLKVQACKIRNREEASEKLWAQTTVIAREEHRAQAGQRRENKKIFREAEKMRKQARKVKHEASCSEVLEDLLDMCDDLWNARMDKYHASADKKLPLVPIGTEQYRDMVQHFIDAKIIRRNQPPKPKAKEEEVEVDTGERLPLPVNELLTQMSTQKIRDFLFTRADWGLRPGFSIEAIPKTILDAELETLEIVDGPIDTTKASDAESAKASDAGASGAGIAAGSVAAGESPAGKKNKALGGGVLKNVAPLMDPTMTEFFDGSRLPPDPVVSHICRVLSEYCEALKLEASDHVLYPQPESSSNTDIDVVSQSNVDGTVVSSDVQTASLAGSKENKNTSSESQIGMSVAATSEAEGVQGSGASKTSSVKSLPEKLIPPVSKKQIEFVLLDGAPLSGKESVVKAIQADEELAQYVKVVDFRAVIQAAQQMVLTYEPIRETEGDKSSKEGGEEEESGTKGEEEDPEDNSLPTELMILKRHNLEAWLWMRNQILTAPPEATGKKGDPPPINYREEGLKKFVIPKQAFEELVALDVAKKMEDTLKSMQIHQDAVREAKQAEMEGLENAVYDAQDAIATITEKHKTMAENNEEMTEEADKELEDAVNAHTEASNRVTEFMQSKLKKIKHYYILFHTQGKYPTTEDETVDFMRNCVLPAYRTSRLQPVDDDGSQSNSASSGSSSGIASLSSLKGLNPINSDKKASEGLRILLRTRHQDEAESDKVKRCSTVVVPQCAGVDHDNLNLLHNAKHAKRGQAGSEISWNSSGVFGMSTGPSHKTTTAAGASTSTLVSPQHSMEQKPPPPVIYLPTLRKCYLMVSHEKSIERKHDAGYTAKTLPPSFFVPGEPDENGEATDPRCICYPFDEKNDDDVLFIDKVHNARLSLYSTAASPLAPIAPFVTEAKRKKKTGQARQASKQRAGFTHTRTPYYQVKAEKKDVTEVLNELKEHVLIAEVEDAGDLEEDVLQKSRIFASKQNYEQWRKLLLVYKEDLFTLVNKLGGQKSAFETELEEISLNFKAYMDATNENLSGIIQNTVCFNVSESGFDRLSDELWDETNKRRQEAEVEFDSILKSPFWAVHVSNLLQDAYQGFLLHYKFCHELVKQAKITTSANEQLSAQTSLMGPSAASQAGPVNGTTISGNHSAGGSSPSNKESNELAVADKVPYHLEFPFPQPDAKKCPWQKKTFDLSGLFYLPADEHRGSPDSVASGGLHPRSGHGKDDKKEEFDSGILVLKQLYDMFSDEQSNFSSMSKALSEMYEQKLRSVFHKFRLLYEAMKIEALRIFSGMESWIKSRVKLENDSIRRYISTLQDKIGSTAPQMVLSLQDFAIDVRRILETTEPVPGIVPPGKWNPSVDSNAPSVGVSKQASQQPDMGKQASQQGGTNAALLPNQKLKKDTTAIYHPQFQTDKFSPQLITQLFLPGVVVVPKDYHHNIEGLKSSCARWPYPSELVLKGGDIWQRFRLAYTRTARYEMEHMPAPVMKYSEKFLSGQMRECGKVFPSPLMHILFYNRQLRADALLRIADVLADHNIGPASLTSGDGLHQQDSNERAAAGARGEGDGTASEENRHASEEKVHPWPETTVPEDVFIKADIWSDSCSVADRLILNKLLYHILTGTLGAYSFSILKKEPQMRYFEDLEADGEHEIPNGTASASAVVSGGQISMNKVVSIASHVPAVSSSLGEADKAKRGPGGPYTPSELIERAVRDTKHALEGLTMQHVKERKCEDDMLFSNVIEASIREDLYQKAQDAGNKQMQRGASSSGKRKSAASLAAEGYLRTLPHIHARLDQSSQALFFFLEMVRCITDSGVMSNFFSYLYLILGSDNLQKKGVSVMSLYILLVKKLKLFSLTAISGNMLLENAVIAHGAQYSGAGNAAPIPPMSRHDWVEEYFNSILPEELKISTAMLDPEEEGGPPVDPLESAAIPYEVFFSRETVYPPIEKMLGKIGKHFLSSVPLSWEI